MGGGRVGEWENERRCSGQEAVGKNLAEKTRFHSLVVQRKTFLGGLCVSVVKSFSWNL
jgi:hypothetical protein